MHGFDPIEWRVSMRKKLCCLLFSVLVIAAFTGCKQTESPQIAATEETGASSTPATEMTKNTTTEPTQNTTTGTMENTTSTSHDSSSEDGNISHTNTYLETDPEQSQAYNRAITAYNAFLNGQIAAKTKNNSKRLISGYGRISDGQSGIDRYALSDVNNDGVPELFIDAAIDHILAFDGENLVEWYSSMSWMGIQLLKNGAVLDTHSGAGTFFNYLTFGPDGIEKFIRFSGSPVGESGQLFYYGEGESESSQKVSKDEWDEMTKPYFEQMNHKAELEWHRWYL